MADDTDMTLDSAMDAAFAKMQDAEKAAPAEVPAAEPVATETPTQAAERARDERGRFAASQSAEAAPVTAAPATPTTDRAEPVAATTAPSTAPVAGPPPGWSAESKAAFAQLPASIQADVLKREKEVSDGFAQKTAELKRYDGLESVIGPRRAVLAAQYGSEAQGIQTLFALSDYAEKDGPGFLRWFAQQRGIDLASLAGTPAGQVEQPPADPALAAVQQRQNAIEQRLQAADAAEQARQQAALESQIATFASDPAHKHFESVRQHMAALMQGGQARDMQDAYDQAVYANPTTRALVLAEQNAAAEKARAEAQAKAVADAKRTRETIVASNGATGASPTKPRSWEETMDARHKELNAA